MSRSHRSTAAVGFLVLPLLLVGCTQVQKPLPTNDDSDFRPPPAPTPYQLTCTPLAGTRTPTPCTQAEYDKLRQKEIDYAAAEAVYRAFFDEDVKLLKSGGLATPEIRLLLAGPMVDQYEVDKQKQHDAGLTTEGDYTLAYARPSDVSLLDGAELALETCADGSKAVGRINGKVVGNAGVVKTYVFLTKLNRQYKVWWTRGEEVTSC